MDVKVARSVRSNGGGHQEGETGGWKESGGCWGGKQKTNVIKLIRFTRGGALAR